MELGDRMIDCRICRKLRHQRTRRCVVGNRIGVRACVVVNGRVSVSRGIEVARIVGADFVRRLRFSQVGSGRTCNGSTGDSSTCNGRTGDSRVLVLVNLASHK